VTLNPTDIWPRQSSDADLHEQRCQHVIKLARQVEREQRHVGIDGDLNAIRHGFIWGCVAALLLLAILCGPDLAAAFVGSAH
jgi:hypothetical protein